MAYGKQCRPGKSFQNTIVNIQHGFNTWNCARRNNHSLQTTEEKPLTCRFCCNALFPLLLYFHMNKPLTNLANVCVQLISLRNEHFFGDAFDVLCFHMYKLQAYFENISVLRILLEKAMP